ncbi:MAG TPA: class II aldolase/adducin family protein [Roseiflexaceae bacterium]|nr:class II aldolase/adducin family protein [Roseiflexaceae bacterium]
MSEDTLRREIVRVGRMLYERGLIVAGDGNISVRIAPELLLTTPSGAWKGMLEPEDMVIVDLEGRVQGGDRRPSSELLMHLAVYAARPDVQAVVHAHPPIAVACTLAGVRMDECVLPEAIITLGAVPTAPFSMTGTHEMCDAIAPFLPFHNAILLTHHGALTVGSSLMQAFHRMEQVEHSAKILMAAQQLGGARPLPPERLAQLDALRIRLGGHPEGGCKPQ